MHTYRLPWVQPGVALLLAMALPACASGAPTAMPSLTATLPLTQTIALPTMTLPATTSATPTGESTAGPPLLSGPDVAFQDVQFTLPAVLVSAVQARLAPEMDILGELYPAYTEFTLVDYNSQNTRIEPQIQIYPVRELGQSATQTVQRLKDLLAGKPAAVPSPGIPILPTIPAGQLIAVQVQYLTFSNGSGIRVLTQFAQNAWPINNEGLVYIFQGLTSDDAYYISAFLPVSASFLPDRVDDPAKVPQVDGISFPQSGSPNFNSEYANYRQAIIHKLNTSSGEEYIPGLNVLDDLVGSLRIESVPAAQEPATVPCVNALPTRLRVGLFAYVNPDPPLPNNLRRDVGKNSSLIGDIQPGQTMKILEGPKCADGWVWWKVRSLEPELVGWTAEGDQQNYWLIPCSSQRECGP